MGMRHGRRTFLAGTAMGATALLVGCSGKDKEEEHEEEVSPPEDLMREHGVLNRILLIYEEGIRRIEQQPNDFDSAVITAAAGLVRRFVEDYHEKQEEDQLFPRFEKAGKLTDLVATLRAQHQAGRRVTEQIQGLTGASDRDRLAGALRAFIRMYRPHEAREDTVLFPALRGIVSPHEFDSLGEDFERREHQLFGEDGFERIVGQVAALEAQAGIADLARFTP